MLTLAPDPLTRSFNAIATSAGLENAVLLRRDGSVATHTAEQAPTATAVEALRAALATGTDYGGPGGRLGAAPAVAMRVPDGELIACDVDDNYVLAAVTAHDASLDDAFRRLTAAAELMRTAPVE